jgi:hypothetical protein
MRKEGGSRCGGMLKKSNEKEINSNAIVDVKKINGTKSLKPKLSRCRCGTCYAGERPLYVLARHGNWVRRVTRPPQITRSRCPAAHPPPVALALAKACASTAVGCITHAILVCALFQELGGCYFQGIEVFEASTHWW